MKFVVLLAAGLGLAYAQDKAHAPADPPKLSDALLKDWFQTNAVYYSQIATYQASITAQQKQAQDDMKKTSDKIAELQKAMTVACGDKATLNGDQSAPACVAKHDPSPVK